MKILFFACLVFVSFLSSFAMAKARSGPVKVLYLETGWVTTDDQIIVPQFLQTLKSYDLQITRSATYINDFDGSQLTQGQFDVIYYADRGQGDYIKIKEAAQVAIRDFVNQGGTFVHEAGFPNLVAANPSLYKTMRELLLFDTSTESCQCYFSFIPSPESQAGLSFFKRISMNPLDNFECILEYRNGLMHAFAENPAELAVQNTTFASSKDMVAVRKVGAGRVVGINFRFYFDVQACKAQGKDFLQFYANLLHYGY